MTVNEYIRQKFSSFGFILNDAELLEITLSSGISGEDEMNKDCFTHVSVAIAKFIPSLLVRPSSYSVSENGHSVSKSWDKDAMRSYYDFLCTEYGLKNELKPKVTFL